MTEQGLLNKVYYGSIEEFPFEYNGNLAAAAQNCAFWNSKLIDIRILRYTWIKPFERGIEFHSDYSKCKNAFMLWKYTYA